MATTKPNSRIGRLYEQLRHQAQRRPGITQRCPLPGGAQISLTISEGVHMLVFSRLGKRLGDIELNTFYIHCDVPPVARRVPEVPYQSVRNVNGQDWHYVGYVWEGEE